jgi:hypothetical protein
MSRFRRSILSKIIQIIPSEWIVDWNASKGDMTDNGFTVSGNNSYGGGYELTSNGQYFDVWNSQNVTIWTPTTSDDTIIQECTFNISLLSDLGIDWYISNGTSSARVQLRYYNNDYQMRVQTAQYNLVTTTGLENIIFNTDCVMRLEYAQDRYLKVYLNDTLYFDNVTYNTGNVNTTFTVHSTIKMLLKAFKLNY